MANFQRDLMDTLKNLFQKIYDEEELNLEYRYYEIWNMALVEITRSLDVESVVACQVTVSPQWELTREVLKYPLDPYMVPEAENNSEEGENYLANLSMEATKPDSSDDDVYSSYDMSLYSDSASEELGKELVKPDFALFHITAGSRRVMLLVEVKPEQLTPYVSEKVFRQAEAQAGFAFDVWPQESVVYSLMLVGRKFYLGKFFRTQIHLSHNKLKQFDKKSYKPSDSSRGNNDKAERSFPNLNAWRNVFDETVVTHQSGERTITTLVEMEHFTEGFKEAINEVMVHNGMGSVRWGNC